jgi:hypothetical protein
VLAAFLVIECKENLFHKEATTLKRVPHLRFPELEVIPPDPRRLDILAQHQKVVIFKSHMVGDKRKLPSAFHQEYPRSELFPLAVLPDRSPVTRFWAKIQDRRIFLSALCMDVNVPIPRVCTETSDVRVVQGTPLEQKYEKLKKVLAYFHIIFQDRYKLMVC